jgi:broad specificity phosphatase PhoE
VNPRRIILVRHGESEANVDASRHACVPNHKIRLSATGRAQALAAGAELRGVVGDGSVQFFVSPYERTRETYRLIRESFAGSRVLAYEDPRLREQDFGNLRDAAETFRLQRERREYGVFFYRFPDGESGADVFDRVSLFLETLHRNFRRRSFPANVVVVTHGLTMRLFVMRWFRRSVEEFESWANPGNCEYRVMERQGNRYVLTRPFDLAPAAADGSRDPSTPGADDLGLGRVSRE